MQRFWVRCRSSRSSATLRSEIRLFVHFEEVELGTEEILFHKLVMYLVLMFVAAFLTAVPRTKSFFIRSLSLHGKQLTSSSNSRTAMSLDFPVSPLSITPFGDMRDLMRQFHLLPTAALSHMAVDVKETDSAYAFIVDLPGVKKEDISINIDDDRNCLMITAERTGSMDEEKENYKHTERYHGKFVRSIPLPSNIDENSIDATTEHGVLTITLPKTEGKKTGWKTIDIK